MQADPWKTAELEKEKSYSVPLDCHSHPGEKRQTHFMKIFQHIGYYLCVFPYKIVETNDGTYKAEKWLFQQIFCGALHLFAISDTIVNLRQLHFEKVARNPKLYFQIFTLVLHTGTILVFTKTVWRKGGQFCKLMRIVEKCPIISGWYPKKTNLAVSLLTIFYVIMALINPIFTGTDGSEISTFQQFLSYHVSRGRFILFMGDDKFGAQSLIKDDNFVTEVVRFKLGDLPFAILSYLAISARWITIYHVDLLMTIMSLSLYCATKFFIRILKTEQTCTNGIRNYEALKHLSSQINSTIGMVTLTYTVDSILFYSTQLEVLFEGGNWFQKVVVVQFFLSCACWLHFASNACLQMEKFREWVRRKDNRYLLPSKSVQVLILLDEISTNTVGLSGNGLFTINYSFVAQALTTLMTYFIIVIQFK